MFSSELKNKQHFGDFIETIRGFNKSANYHPRIMKSSYPVVNFMIFELPKPKKSEVWFGFGMMRGHPFLKVFRSTDSNVVAYFDKYWELLKEDSKEWLLDDEM